MNNLSNSLILHFYNSLIVKDLGCNCKRGPIRLRLTPKRTVIDAQMHCNRASNEKRLNQA